MSEPPSAAEQLRERRERLGAGARFIEDEIERASEIVEDWELGPLRAGRSELGDVFEDLDRHLRSGPLPGDWGEKNAPRIGMAIALGDAIAAHELAWERPPVEPQRQTLEIKDFSALTRSMRDATLEAIVADLGPVYGQLPAAATQRLAVEASLVSIVGRVSDLEARIQVRDYAGDGANVAILKKQLTAFETRRQDVERDLGALLEQLEGVDQRTMDVAAFHQAASEERTARREREVAPLGPEGPGYEASGLEGGVGLC